MSGAHPLGAPRRLSLPDGRSLSARRAGVGRAVVVFESGMGFSAAAWGRVVPAVSCFAATVCYDRAGIGASDEDGAPRTLVRLADDLGALLAAETRPLILVGHSWGGPIVRTLAARRTLDVRALVLVDQTDEHIDSYFTPALAERMVSRPPRFSSLSARASIALLRRRALHAQPMEVGMQLRRDLAALERTMAPELAQFLPSLSALRQDAAHLDAVRNIRASVITGMRAGFGERTRRREINRAHATTARRLDAHLIPATRSGHNVIFDQPELIVAELRRVVDEAGLSPRG
ncbi:alpha/beta fold hydrolase [Microbacterium sp. Clip185]|uniref:alpha/beta fold hydrolase n=1 Tax=Microbacterium sp. Clip185 TaxID=3025663 RepID=UPI002365712D|nr:alpha/beta hydrolase [Microbacterium sp. Clip185]WDG19295.1 alpha/beta hydrolase [Microbacterium sp. Clip185]